MTDAQAMTSSPPCFCFERHRAVKRPDRNCGLVVAGRLCRDPLQPQSRCGHGRQKTAAALCGEADQLIAEARDDGNQYDARGEFRREAVERQKA